MNPCRVIVTGRCNPRGSWSSDEGAGLEGCVALPSRFACPMLFQIAIGVVLPPVNGAGLHINPS